jgi:hypothetical protein
MRHRLPLAARIRAGQERNVTVQGSNIPLVALSSFCDPIRSDYNFVL